VAKVCAQSGLLGDSAFARLIDMDSATPSTHIESADGDLFSFTRRPPEFDVNELEKWLED
jgi:hypothetical protein